MARPLHYVFKVGDRSASIKFFVEVLQMKIFRHEEFSEGCKATCNGPYDTRWSKTMLGYGSEDTNFVLELTYNYGINSYRNGTDFVGIWIHDSDLFSHIQSHGAQSELVSPDTVKLTDPDNHAFYVANIQKQKESDPIDKVSVHVSDLSVSIDYWHSLLRMKLYSHDDNHALLGFADGQTKLELLSLHGQDVDRGEAFGRIAFSVPYAVPSIEEKVMSANRTILNPLMELETPGKTTVRVLILADPDAHEICFVNDEGFRELSVYDPESEKELKKMIAAEERRKH